jgi:hypothetical protein
LNSLDFEAATFVDAVIPTPCTVPFKVQSVLFQFLLNQLVDDMLDVLAATFVSLQRSFMVFSSQ